jgi:hypothetical protein
MGLTGMEPIQNGHTFFLIVLGMVLHVLQDLSDLSLMPSSGQTPL